MASPGAAGFAKGFATGFVNERNRRLGEEADTDKMTLQYRLQELSKEKDKRNEQKLKDEEIVKTGKLLGQMYDPEFGKYAIGYLQRGMSMQEIMEHKDKGHFKKSNQSNTGIVLETKNPDLVPQEPAKIPAGVLPVNNTPVINPEIPVVNDLTKNAQIDPSQIQDTAPGKVYSEDDARMARADEKIKSFAPSLFEDDGTPKVEEFQSLDDNSYSYVPETIEKKEESVREIVYQRMLAEQNGDEGAARVWRLKEKAASIVANMNKEAQPGEFDYLALQPDGTVRTQFKGKTVVGPDGREMLMNVTMGGEGAPVTSPRIRISKEAADVNWQMTENYGKMTEDYAKQQVSFIGALSTAQKMEELANAHPVALTTAGTFLNTLTTVQNELVAGVDAYQGLGSLAKSIEEDIAKGDTSKLTEKNAAFKKSISEMFVNPKGMKDAEAKVLFSALKSSLVYDLASAAGQTGQGLSDKDVKRFDEMIAGDTPPVLARSLKNALSKINLNINASQATLTNRIGPQNERLRQMLGEAGYDKQGRKIELKTGFEIPRTGKVIDQMYRDNPAEAQKLNSYMSSINRDNPLDQTLKTNHDLTAPVEVEVNGKKFLTGKVYKTPSGKSVTITPDGKWIAAPVQ